MRLNVIFLWVISAWKSLIENISAVKIFDEMFSLTYNIPPSCLFWSVLKGLCSSHKSRTNLPKKYYQALIPKSWDYLYNIIMMPWTSCLMRLIKYTCSWCNQPIISWRLNRQRKIFLCIYLLFCNLVYRIMKPVSNGSFI